MPMCEGCVVTDGCYVDQDRWERMRRVCVREGERVVGCFVDQERGGEDEGCLCVRGVW